MEEKVLVCIAFHYTPSRIPYLLRVVNRFLSYDSQNNIKIIVDTNSKAYESYEISDAINQIASDSRVEFHVHDKLAHPYQLTWAHRSHFSKPENLALYDVFVYAEDDMDIPYDHFREYLANFTMLWNINLVPSFLRIERYQDVDFVTDAEYGPIKVKPSDVLTEVSKNTKKHFIKVPRNYHAFWIMPTDVLRSLFVDESVFLKFKNGRGDRELAASYPTWELGRTACLQVFKDDSNILKVHPTCISYHIANNYATNPHTRFGKVPLADILQPL